MGVFPRVVRGRDFNTSAESLWAGFSCEPKRLRRRSQANSALEPPSLFDLDSIPASHAIDNVFRALPIEVVFRPRAADDYFASATFIVDGIIYRFFEFSLEGVRGAASDEDVVFGETVKGNRMSEPLLTIVFRSGNDASCMSGGCDMSAVEGSATWFPAFAAPAGDTRQLYGNALSLAIGVLLDHAAMRSDYDDCPSYQLRTDLL